MIKKTIFDELHTTFNTVLTYVDNTLIEAKKNGGKVWEGKKNFKTFLQDIEKTAIKKTAEELKLTVSTVNERWKVLTLPYPFYFAVENGAMSYSKLKPMINFNFDFNGDKDNECAKRILSRIINDNKPLKDVAQEEMLVDGIWNESDITMRRIAEQHGITE